MTLAAGDSSTLLVSGAVLALVFAAITVTLLRRRQLRPAPYRRRSDPDRSTSREQVEIRQSLESLLQQIENAAARVAIDVESRLSKLADAVARAESTLALLKSHGRDASAAPAAARDSEPQQEQEPNRPPPPRTARRMQIRTAGAALDVPVAAGSPLAADAEISDKIRRVHELADAGMTTVDIARHVGMILGEVELILNLRKLQ